MQILQRGNDLRRVKLGVFLGQTLARSRLERPEELAAHTIVEHEEEIVGGLERVEEGDDEGVVRGGEDFLFG